MMYQFVLSVESNSREVRKMGAIAKAAVIKNRKDKKDDKKD